MPTIVDALVTTITLDPAGYKRGQEMVARSNKELREDATKTAKELSSQGKQMAEFFTAAKTEVLGLIGALVGSAGIVAFTKDTTRALADMGREARNIGISAQSLNAFQNVIERNGGSAQSATASMKGLVDQIERFKVFGDPTVFKFLNPIGANINDSPLMIWQKFVKFAAEHKNDMPLVNLVGHGLGFDQGLINATIQIGDVTKATQELHNEMQRVATPAMVEDATKLQTAWTDLGHQAVFVGEEVLDNFSPALSAVATGMTTILQNKEAVPILTGLVAVMTTLAGLRITGGLAWLLGFRGMASGIGALLGLIERLVPLLTPLALSGDTHPDPEAGPGGEVFGENGPVAHWWMNNMPSWLGGGRGSIGGGATRERMAEVRDSLSKDLGISTEAASGIVSNLNAESGLQGINEKNPVSGRGGFGWAQWTGPRRVEFEAFAKAHSLDPASDAANYNFLIYELKTKYPGLLAQLRAGKITATQAANLVFTQYESGGDPGLEHDRASHVGKAELIAGLTAPTGASGINIPDPSMVPKPGSNTAIANNSTDKSIQVHVGTQNINTQASDAGRIASDMHQAMMNDLIIQGDRGIE